MEKLNEKIKRLRLEKELSQENIHHQQSVISQIENGRISNPTENVLREIAEKLEITFESLVNDTDWKPESFNKNISEWAISPSELRVTMDNNGNWNYTYVSYPVKNSTGEVNKFSPMTGEPLISKCGNCNRNIIKPEQRYCMNCGREIIPIYPIYHGITEPMSSENLLYEDGIESTIHQLLEFSDILTELKGFLHKQQIIINSMTKKGDLSIESSNKLKMELKKELDDPLLRLSLLKVDHYDLTFELPDIDLSEFVMKKINKITFNLRLIDGLLSELKKFRTRNPAESIIKEIQKDLYQSIAEKIHKTAESLTAAINRDPLESNELAQHESLGSDYLQEKFDLLNQLIRMLQTISDSSLELPVEGVESTTTKTPLLDKEKDSTDSMGKSTESAEKRKESSEYDDSNRKQKNNKKGE